MPLMPHSKPLNDTIAFIRHDITKLQYVDCVVNAANNSLLGGGGVDGAIHRAAGPALLEECNSLDGCNTGSAKITFAYDLPYQRVIHAVGPIYAYEKRKDERRPEALLRSCYRRCFELAIENNMKSVAFPAVSTGVYGYPSQLAAEVVLDETRKFLEEDGNIGKLEKVIFCTFEAKDQKAYEQLIPVFFPPGNRSQSKGRDSPTKSPRSPKNKGSKRPSASPEILAARLPDPPTAEPILDGQPESKRKKTSAVPVERDVGVQNTYDTGVSDDRSEDDWEEVDRSEGFRTEKLDDEPVEIDRPPSATDVHSVQSSGIIDMVESHSTDGFLEKH